MNVLLAPAQFKESISAGDVASLWRHTLDDLGISSVCRPISDGGEGFLDVFLSAGANEITVAAQDALGRRISAGYAVDGDTAYIEMAITSGLEQIEPASRDPLISSTYGTGIQIRDALSKGAEKVVVGLGGSATNDGGLGVFRAMGGKLLKDGKELEFLWDIDPSCTLYLDEFIHTSSSFVAATDVQNPLLGEYGATYVYARQKGLNTEEFAGMDNKMGIWANLIEDWRQKQFRDNPGAGAAGGLGFGLMGLFNAAVEPGFDIISREIHLTEEIRKADLVITGEGKMDSQSAFGKAPHRLIQLCQELNTPVMAIAGQITRQPEGLAGSCSLVEMAGDKQASMKYPRKYLSAALKSLIGQYPG